MKQFGILVLIGLLFHAGYGQAGIRRLHVGDTMPETVLTMLSSGQDSVLHTTDLTKKLTVLSFWTPSCSYSSSQLPVLDRLQQQFPDDIEIIPVGFDGREDGATQQYITALKRAGINIRLPIAKQPFRNPPLYQMLPFMGLPQNVWLDRNHVILGITDNLALTPEHIRQAITGQSPSLDLKDFDTTFDVGKPLLVAGNGGADSDFIYRSLITPYKPFLSMGEIRERTSRYTRITEGNVTPVVLLQSAMAGADSTGIFPIYDPMNKRLRNLVKRNALFDTAWYDLPQEESGKAEALRKKQLFCYELMLPAQFSYPFAYSKMLADLCDYFGVKAGVEKQPVTTLLIVKKGKLIKEVSSNGEEQITVSRDQLSYHFTHCTVHRIAEVLNNALDLPLFADGTGDTSKMSLSLHLRSLMDRKELESALLSIGLTIEEKKIATDLFVIRDR